MTTRTDVHRPSVIDPVDYHFVAFSCLKIESVGDVYFLAEERERLFAFMKRTGATYSRHAHGGTCHVCGAHCIYTAVFHHVPTGKLILCGLDCAEKLDGGIEDDFKVFRDKASAFLKNRASKAKARAIFEAVGLERAWDIAQLKTDPTNEPLWKCRDCGGRGCDHCEGCGVTVNSFLCIKSIVSSVVRKGCISEKAEESLPRFIHTVDNWDEIVAEREAEKEAERLSAEPCPEGRIELEGEVVSTRWEDNSYSSSLKMLFRSDKGFKLWGSVPDSISLIDVPHRCEDTGEEWTTQRGLEKGDRIKFRAAVTPSTDDDRFGFYKRPTKAELVSLETVLVSD